jgi:hypothetical protein
VKKHGEGKWKAILDEGRRAGMGSWTGRKQEGHRNDVHRRALRPFGEVDQVIRRGLAMSRWALSSQVNLKDRWRTLTKQNQTNLNGVSANRVNSSGAVGSLHIVS